MTKAVILVTGATGLLGSQLILQLLRENYALIACKRAQSIVTPCSSHPLLTWVDIEQLLQNKIQLETKVEFVIHLAGLVSYASRDKKALFDSNEGLTKLVIDWCLNHKVKKLIYISSIAALGKDTTKNIISEETHWSEKQFSSNYGASKRAGEKAIKSAAKYGLEYIILNPSVIVGPAPLNRSSAKLFKYIEDEKPFFTRGFINYVDVRDLCDLIIIAMIKLPNNTCYIVNAGHTTYQKLFSLIAKGMNKRTPKIAIPTSLVLFGAILENIYCKIFCKNSLLSVETAKMAGKKYIYSANKLNKITGYEYHSLKDTVEYTIHKMKKNSYLKL
jgi:nucleoside-diphosphate-sugar epimerase